MNFEPTEFSYTTGCKSPNYTLFKINILKKTLLVKKQTIHQQKALDLSFNLAPWKWAWHHQEGATPYRREKHRSAWGKKSCSMARGRDSLMLMPRPLSRCQIKAEIQGFLLMHRLFLYQQWLLPILNSNIFRIRLLHPVLHTYVFILSSYRIREIQER